MAVDTTKSANFDDNGLTLTDRITGVDVLWVGAGTATPTFTAPENGRYYKTDGTVYRQVDGPTGTNWVVQGDRNIDGGFANSVYLPDQCFDGGGA